MGIRYRISIYFLDSDKNYFTTTYIMTALITRVYACVQNLSIFIFLALSNHVAYTFYYLNVFKYYISSIVLVSRNWRFIKHIILYCTCLHVSLRIDAAFLQQNRIVKISTFVQKCRYLYIIFFCRYKIDSNRSRN